MSSCCIISSGVTSLKKKSALAINNNETWSMFKFTFLFLNPKMLSSVMDFNATLNHINKDLNYVKILQRLFINLDDLFKKNTCTYIFHINRSNTMHCGLRLSV